MTHFRVGVVIPHKNREINDKDVAAILAPYSEEHDPENGKWDWYSIGGRFDEALCSKIIEGERYVSNCMRIGDIDWEYTKDYHDGDSYLTWAVVDEYGWEAPGEVGWWGTDTSTEESCKIYEKFFEGYMKDPDNQDKYLVIVDCHI